MPRPKTTDIELGQAEIIDGLYKKYGGHDAAHSFKSLFIWKEDMGLSVHLTLDMYAVYSSIENEDAWFFPVGEDDAKRAFITTLLENDESVTFKYMTERDVKFLNTSFPDKFLISEAECDSEYIMDRAIMETLPGSHFAKDRGHINRLLKTHDIKTVDINDLEREKIFEIVTVWDENRSVLEETIDKTATMNIINYLEQLKLTGLALMLDDKPCAVIAGFPLDSDTIDCCLQKASSNIQGLSYYLRQEYARSQPTAVKFFNWEEDLGIEGLRRAKTLMKPVGMINMYTGYAG